MRREWVDAITDTAEHAPPAGLVAAHFHLAEDGHGILNLAEWTDIPSHIAALESPTAGQRWEKTLTRHGIRFHSFERYHPNRSLTVG